MQENGREQRIREEAFLLWNADGRPQGQAEQYWHRAEKVIDEIDRLARREERQGSL
jgi:hypothetical protein